MNSLNRDREKKVHYRVRDGCNSPIIFETLEEALEYLTDCLDGINNDSPISIEKISAMKSLLIKHGNNL